MIRVERVGNFIKLRQDTAMLALDEREAMRLVDWLHHAPRGKRPGSRLTMQSEDRTFAVRVDEVPGLLESLQLELGTMDHERMRRMQSYNAREVW